MVDARLPDGSRLNVVLPPLAVDGPSITIRKFTAGRLGIEQLVEQNSLSVEAAEFLRSAVASKANILVSGGTGTGKTTILNILSSFIDRHERVVTVEDAVELSLDLPNHFGQHALHAAHKQHVYACTGLSSGTRVFRSDSALIRNAPFFVFFSE